MGGINGQVCVSKFYSYRSEVSVRLCINLFGTVMYVFHLQDRWCVYLYIGYMTDMMDGQIDTGINGQDYNQVFYIIGYTNKYNEDNRILQPGHCKDMNGIIIIYKRFGQLLCIFTTIGVGIYIMFFLLGVGIVDTYIYIHIHMPWSNHRLLSKRMVIPP